jgi:hypothetical protein
MDEIIVYDDYKISLYKYPRKNNEKEQTDIIIIIFLMHEEFLKKLGKSLEEALKFYYDCKEYYYIFNFNKVVKKYSAQELMNLKKNMDNFFIQNNNPYIQQQFIKKLNELDVILYFYIKNKDFYLNLFESIEDAKKAYFERRDYSYRVIVPTDFYNNIIPKVYNAVELMELNAYTQYCVEKKIIQDLPIPKYLDL